MASSSAPGTDLSGLVVGAGSIGRRHLTNLARMGVHPLGAVDPLIDRARGALAAVGGGQAFAALDDALSARRWDVAVVASPSSVHVAPAAALALAGSHLLVEKPLSNDLTGVVELLEVVERSGVVAMMAMCYRFHPAFVRIRDLLGRGAIGRVVAARCQGGYYLPWWHPSEDYRREYAAQSGLGGGVLLTNIHGLDYVRWLFGEVAEASAVVERVSDLEMDVEDLVVGICRMRSGAVVCLWTDFLQRVNEHRIQVNGTTGDLSWSVADNCVRRVGSEPGPAVVEPLPADSTDAMYVAELRAFLDAVRAGGAVPVPLMEGVRDLQLVDAFRRSAGDRRPVLLGDSTGAAAHY